MVIYGDTGSLLEMQEMSAHPRISGFTTNPTLIKKAGVTEYLNFCSAASRSHPDKPISLEVFADDFGEMARQARILADIGPNVYVKIPVTDTNGAFAGGVIELLSKTEVKVNVTAVMDYWQVERVMEILSYRTPSIVSVFAGRIADTGRDPTGMVRYAMENVTADCIKILWASPRQVRDVYLAEEVGCDIITISKDILSKLDLRHKDLSLFSLDTVKMFRNDALAAGFTL